MKISHIFDAIPELDSMSDRDRKAHEAIGFVNGFMEAREPGYTITGFIGSSLNAREPPTPNERAAIDALRADWKNRGFI